MPHIMGFLMTAGPVTLRHSTLGLMLHNMCISGLPWVWRFPWGFPWIWVWDWYGDCDESPWACGKYVI